MVKYKVRGQRWLRKYTAARQSPVYAASIDAQTVVDSFCDVPWVRVFEKDANMTYHTDEVIDAESKITGLDMNVRIRDTFDAALFCAGHAGGQHRAYANAACYRYELPTAAVGNTLTSLDVQVTSDPYNSRGVRLHVFTNTTGEMPMNCHTLRGEDPSGEIIEDGTTAAEVAPRTTERRGNADYWYPTTETATLSPTGGMTLQKYLFILVALESYSTVRGNWLEGSAFIKNAVEVTLSSSVNGWSADDVNDLSGGDGLVEVPVVRHATTQCNYGEISCMYGVAVLANGDSLADLGAIDADGQRRYSIPSYLRQLYAPETYDADPTRFYVGLRALYAKFYDGNMEMAKRPNARLRPGAGFSVRPQTWTILDAGGVESSVQGWSIAASVTALAFSAPLSLSVIKMRLDWGASGSGTGGTVNGGHYNFWLKRGAYVDSLPESLVKNPDIYTAAKSSVDGWEYLGSSSGDFFETELSTPLNSEHATVLVTAYADQKSTMSPGFMSGANPWGASTEFDIIPSGVNPDFSVNTGSATSANSLMTPDITLYGVGEEEAAPDPVDPPDPQWWLCFTAEEANSTISMTTFGSAPPEVTLKTSVDGGQTWTPFVVGSTVITLPNVGDKVYFAAGEGGNEHMAEIVSNSRSANSFAMTGRVAASGNVMSLLNAEALGDTVGSGCFLWLFRECTALTTAPKLSATTLAPNCYFAMFSGCTSLATAPQLPATTLAASCYRGMFIGCTSLAVAPQLPATTLAEECYYGMFGACTSLVSAPELPATTLAPSCYQDMFSGCASLVVAPELPATALASRCYAGMFGRRTHSASDFYCTSLVVAPSLPATTLATECYREMFRGCTSLTSAPSLPATTLATECYREMFWGCTSLTYAASSIRAEVAPERCCREMFWGCTSLVRAPDLLFTTLGAECCYGMFHGCTSLVSAPALTATTLAGLCYYDMFYGCTSLVYAPELPATTLASLCYYDMFHGCTSLVSAPAIFATTLNDDGLRSMFDGCSSLSSVRVNFTSWNNDATRWWINAAPETGTFRCPAELGTNETITRGISNCPEGWTVINI